MFLEIAAAGYMIGNYVYHRYKESQDVDEKEKPQELSIPRVDEAAPITLIYGRCRVRQPILVWHAPPETALFDGNVEYRMDMYFVVGVGFADGTGVSGLHGVWYGDQALTFVESAPESIAAQCDTTTLDGEYIGGGYEWYDGNSAQEHVDSSGAAVTTLGTRILPHWDAETVPGFRGYLSAFLFGAILGTPTQFCLGRYGRASAISFEASSYLDENIYSRSGPDASPITVLRDLLTRRFGKLGIPTSYIDDDSFTAAQITLHRESHGYSRAIESVEDGTKYILEILEQIDGVLYEESYTGKLHVKLIRNDYDPATVGGYLNQHIIDKDNCKDIVNWSMSSPDGVPNAVRVTFPDREKDYQDNSVVDKYPANAVGGSGITRWITKRFPGCTNIDLARRLAARELAAEGRPIQRCRALVDRRFIYTAPGDVVKVNWASPDISGRIFRVAGVDRGTLEDGVIALDLIEDYFYVSRDRTPRPLPTPRFTLDRFGL